METLAIIGVGVSLILQFVKKYTKDVFETYLVLFCLSILGATVYFFLKETVYWTDIISILTIAGAFHNYILRRFEEKK